MFPDVKLRGTLSLRGNKTLSFLWDQSLRAIAYKYGESEVHV